MCIVYADVHHPSPHRIAKEIFFNLFEEVLVWQHRCQAYKYFCTISYITTNLIKISSMGSCPSQTSSVVQEIYGLYEYRGYMNVSESLRLNISSFVTRSAASYDLRFEIGIENRYSC